MGIPRLGIYNVVKKNSAGHAEYLKFQMGLKKGVELDYRIDKRATLKIDREAVRVKQGDRWLTFRNSYPWTAIAIGYMFSSNDYDMLKVKGRTVVDVGSSIGDSAIYFALKGAKHVYGFEVDRKRCDEAAENIKANHLASKITIFNSEFDRSLIEERDIVMKLDCEGCEYSLLPSMKMAKELVMEYHNGKDRIVDYLERVGYMVKIVKEENADMGILFARRGS